MCQAHDTILVDEYSFNYLVTKWGNCVDTDDGWIELVIRQFEFNRDGSPYKIEYWDSNHVSKGVHWIQALNPPDESGVPKGYDTLSNLANGLYYMTITDSLGCYQDKQIKVNDPINPKMTLRAKGLKKVYDGIPVSLNSINVVEYDDNWKVPERAEYYVTSDQWRQLALRIGDSLIVSLLKPDTMIKDVDSVRNIIDGWSIKDAETGKDKTCLYHFYPIDSCIVIVPATLTLFTGSATKEYDGTELINHNWNVQGLENGERVWCSPPTGSQTDVGTSANEVTSYVIKNANGETKTDYFTNVTTVAGTLTVEPVDLFITTPSATKPYDGTALTAAFDPSTGAGSISGLASNESITVTTTGSQTEVGESANTYTIDWGTTNPNNYEISDNLGVLTIVDDTLIVVGTLETVTVNGCTASDAPAPYTTVEGLESAGLTIQGDCPGEPTLSNNYQSSSCTGDFTYNYTYQDCAGKVFQWYYTYHVLPSQLHFTDNGLTDVTLDNACYSADVTSHLKTNGDVWNMYSTDCNNIHSLSVTSEDVVESASNCSWKVTRTFTITNGCVTETKTQSVSGGNTTAPTFAAPNNITVFRNLDSTYDIDPAVTGTVSNVSATCSTADTTYQDSAPATNPDGSLTIVRSWTMTDTCQNATTKEQVITVEVPHPCVGVTWQGYDYAAVKVGSQCWLTENLRWATGNHHAFNEDDANVEKFGYLYSWYTAMGVPENDNNAVPATQIGYDGEPYVQGICPEGWAVANEADFALLFATAGSTELLKDPGTLYWINGHEGTVPNTGFNARANGHFNSVSQRYEDQLTSSYFWMPGTNTSTFNSAVIQYYCNEGLFSNHPKTDLQGVRCIRKIAQ